MVKYQLIVLLILTATFGFAQQLINVPGRAGMSLNGKWQILIDPYENGFYNYRYQENPNGFFKAAKPKGKDDFVEYSFEGAPQLNVPGDWNSQRNDLLYYEGTVWYHKSFPFTKKAGKRYFLHFAAVNYKAYIYLNGEKLGQHEGGFTPFHFEVTERLIDGNNFVVVKADNKRAADYIPTLNTDWWNFGGITRDVTLVEVPAVFIEDYFIQLKKNTTDQIEGWVKLHGVKNPENITIHMPQAKITQQVTTDNQGFVKIAFPAKLTLWTPENPYLYDVIITSQQDKIQEKIGFRSIAVQGQAILLNGKSTFLRGVCIHEEVPQRMGGAWSEEDARMLLGWAKELGCNYVRLAHYPHNENMTRVADELGLMVWSEIPVYWTIQFDNNEVLNKAKQQLKEMINRDRNRASVVLWSVGNETPVGEARTQFLKTLVEEARRLDHTRLLTAALEIKGWSGQEITIDDPLGEYLDVLGCNEYAGWYTPWRPAFATLPWTTPYNKPLIISEFGGEALYGNYGDKDVASSWSEEHQEQLYQRQISMFSNIPFLRGTTPWILTDFRSPRRQLPHLQDGWNRKGLLSEQGQKKKAFFVMQNYYQELAKKWK
ncbi:MAG: glycoside hydrolase family 2 protein [Saprospiraceae bacterium]